MWFHFLFDNLRRIELTHLSFLGNAQGLRDGSTIYAIVAVLRFAVVVGGGEQTAGWAVCHWCQLCVVTNR